MEGEEGGEEGGALVLVAVDGRRDGVAGAV